MMLAWSSLSMNTVSSLPTMAEIVPRFVWNPVENVIAAGLSMNFARRSSSSSWMSSVPFKNLEPAQPVPYFFMAAIAASFTLGWLVRPR